MREKILSEFMEVLQHCDTVKVVLTGVGESQFKTKDIYLGISKLEQENAELCKIIQHLKGEDEESYIRKTTTTADFDHGIVVGTDKIEL